jgi:hypothetical protein
MSAAPAQIHDADKGFYGSEALLAFPMDRSALPRSKPMDQGDRLHPSFGLETNLKITTLARPIAIEQHRRIQTTGG